MKLHLSETISTQEAFPSYPAVGLAASLFARLKGREIDNYTDIVWLTGRAEMSSVARSTDHDQVDQINPTSSPLIFTLSGIVAEQFDRHSGSVPRSRFLNVATSR